MICRCPMLEEGGPVRYLRNLVSGYVDAHAKIEAAPGAQCSIQPAHMSLQIVVMQAAFHSHRIWFYSPEVAILLELAWCLRNTDMYREDLLSNGRLCQSPWRSRSSSSLILASKSSSVG